MKGCVWYISKYVAPPTDGSAGGRGYVLMREISKLGYESIIIASDSNQLTPVPTLTGPHLKESSDNFTVLWLRTAKYRIAKSIKRIWSWVDFEFRLLLAPLGSLPKPDVIVVSSLSLLTVFNGLRLRRRFRSRLVFEVRDIWPLTITEEGGFGVRNPLVLALGMVERLGYRTADAIVGTMPNLGEHVAKVLGRPAPTHCIPMGVDEVAITDGVPLPEDYARQHLPRGKFVVGYVGTIGITNALDTLLECVRAMRHVDSVHFLIVGDGDLRARYQSECSDLSNITFAPKVGKQMVQSVLEHCDLLYFSTYDSEVWKYGQSLNKVIDYMYSGRPIVASFNGFPSMINEADCGSFVPAGDAEALRVEIERYAAMDAHERREIGERGHRWLKQHRSYPQLAKDYVEVLFPADARSA